MPRKEATDTFLIFNSFLGSYQGQQLPAIRAVSLQTNLNLVSIQFVNVSIQKVKGRTYLIQIIVLMYEAMDTYDASTY